MELKHYIGIFVKWWWLIVACVVIASVSSYISSRSIPRVYQATTTVRIGQTLEEANPSYQDFYTSQQLAQTYADIVKRRPILEGVAIALDLDYIPNPGNISANQVVNTQLLQISVRDTDPQLAQAIADGIAKELIRQSPTASETLERDRGFILEQIDDLKIKIEETQDEVDEEQAKLDAANSARAIQQYENNIATLEQKLTTYRANYASLMQSLQSGSINYISIIEPAQLPQVPVSPDVPLTVALAAAIGAGLAIGAAFLLEYLDDTIKTPQDVERVMGYTTLGAITQISDVAQPSDALITALDTKSPTAEAYRVVRTNLQFASAGRPSATLMVTSSESGEGKTTTLANLGVALAQAGKQVVLVDTDLRRPSLHKLFGLGNSIGLTSMLLDETLHPQDVALPTNTPNLRMICSGPRPPNPAELIELERMDQIIEALKQEADIVLFDTPPILAVADASIMASKLDGLLMVIEMGVTRTEIARRAAEALQRASAVVLGVVMNKVQQSRSGYRYYYYNYYYYQYNYDKGEAEGTDGQRRRRSSRSWWARLWRRRSRRSSDSEAPSESPS